MLKLEIINVNYVDQMQIHIDENQFYIFNKDKATFTKKLFTYN